jgi:protein-L-isoaspartate(D-aspartate) O-methyltransferase
MPRSSGGWISLPALATILVSCGAFTSSETQHLGLDWNTQRQRMVDEQLRARDIRDARVLAAMAAVPRHLFVPEPERADAYGDFPLSIGYGQTISQPYIVAFMTQALDVGPDHKVLEIGTGSGYQAAVLARLVKTVYTLEIVEPLAERSRALLKDLGISNVSVRAGNGYLGWPEEAPFDRIIVTAAPDDVPSALVQQLKVGGRMAIPVGTISQELRILRRTERGIETLATLPVRFVPMTGKPKP